MIFKIFIGLLVLAAFIYYIFCFLEVFGFIKFTPKDVDMTFPKALIPFYYLFKKEKKQEEKKNPIQVIKNSGDYIVENPNYESDKEAFDLTNPAKEKEKLPEV